VLVLLQNFKNIFVVSDLRKKVLFTLGVLAIFRFGSHIPLPGIDPGLLIRYMSQVTGGLFSYLDLISGGAIRRFAIFALGIGPYIQASIMMQVLTMAIPSLEALAKEGGHGRQVINQYTRYLTLVISVIQSLGLAYFAESQGLALSPGWAFRLTSVLILSVGTLFVMWLGEQISAHGIGNGSSMLIFGSIVADLPGAVVKVINDLQLGQFDPLLALLLCAITVIVVSSVIFLEKGERKIPVQYAKRVIGNKVYGGQSAYIPLKINTAGVIPVIFAASVIGMPMMIVNFLSQKFPFLAPLAEWFSPRGFVHGVFLVALILFFDFFFTAVVFNPEELADQMRKSGGFVPGIRPGRKTSEFFNYVLTRVTVLGATYLATLTVAPDILSAIFYFPVIFSGVSLLIVVGVALDTSAQLESYLMDRNYEGFLAKGRLSGRGGRNHA
jgi:preprotein translocase subunit SecY